jgi:hypothetical protein
MLRYRALLIDTEKSYQRPVQQFFNDIEQATDWAKKTLAAASKTAYVVFYRTTEEEMHSLTREDLYPRLEKASDQIAGQGIRQTP